MQKATTAIKVEENVDKATAANKVDPQNNKTSFCSCSIYLINK